MVCGFKDAFICLLNVRQGGFQLWFLFKREVMPKKEFYKMLEIISYPKHMCFFLLGKSHRLWNFYYLSNPCIQNKRVNCDLLFKSEDLVQFSFLFQDHAYENWKWKGIYLIHTVRASISK